VTEPSKDYSHLEAKPLYASETKLESLLDRLSVVVKKNRVGSKSEVEKHWTLEQQKEWEVIWEDVETNKEKIHVVCSPHETLYNPKLTYSNKSNYRSNFWNRIYLIDVGIDFASLLVEINRAATDGSLVKGGKYTLKFFEKSLVSIPKILDGSVKTLTKSLKLGRNIVDASLVLGKIAGKGVETGARLAVPVAEAVSSSGEVLEFVFEATPQAIDLALKSAEAAIVILEAAPQVVEAAAGAGKVALSLGEVAFSILNALP
jgi:hypothetical protein